MKDAKAHHTVLVTKIRDYLQQSGAVSDLQFQGSSYEGIKVMTNRTDLEFDCLVLLTGGESLQKIPGEEWLEEEGYVRFEIDRADKPMRRKFAGGSTVLSTRLVKENFFGQLQKAVNALGYSNDIILRSHGPAAQMDVMKPGTRTLWYSVDMVAGFEVAAGVPGQTEIYVAKPHKKRCKKSSWRRSFSKEEKDMMNDIDADNGCRKPCLRMLKVLSKIDPALKPLQSYFFKTTLLTMVRDESKSWDQTQLGLRLVDLLRKIQNYLKEKILPHYFCPSMNLLIGFKAKTMKKVVKHIDSLLSNEQVMSNLLSQRV